MKQITYQEINDSLNNGDKIGYELKDIPSSLIENHQTMYVDQKLRAANNNFKAIPKYTKLLLFREPKEMKIEKTFTFFTYLYAFFLQVIIFFSIGLFLKNDFNFLLLTYFVVFLILISYPLYSWFKVKSIVTKLQTLGFKVKNFNSVTSGNVKRIATFLVVEVLLGMLFFSYPTFNLVHILILSIIINVFILIYLCFLFSFKFNKKKTSIREENKSSK